MKKEIRILILALICILAVFMVSCKDNGEIDVPKDDVVVKEVQLTLEKYCDAKYSFNFSSQGDVVWSSSDDTVASASNGFIVGRSVGSAVISASCGNEKYNINVTVIDRGFVPIIDLRLVHGEIEITSGDTYTATPVLIYKGKEYSDVIFSFIMGDSSLAEVDSTGIITAKAQGDTTLTVTAEWRGCPVDFLTCEVPLKIN